MKAILEGLLFIAGSEGLSIDEIAKVLEIDKTVILENLSELQKEYEDESHGIQLSVLGNKYKFITKTKYSSYYKKMATTTQHNLSDSALETLAIIAYNSPITRNGINEIRGVDSTYVIRKLEQRELIESKGRSEEPGHPILYQTTNKFLDYFGLKNLDELPVIEEISEDDSESDLFKSKYQEEI